MALVKEASRDGYVADGSVRSGELTTSEFDAEMPNVVVVTKNSIRAAGQ
jgi:hypothetical protein